VTPAPETGRAQEPWDAYEAAADGLPEYWYPVPPSRQLGRRFRSVRLLGRDVVPIRDGGRIHALDDRCPHRHVKLSMGRHACENGFDEAHGKMPHRTSWWLAFKRMSGWNVTEIIRGADRVWLTRHQHEVHDDDDYPGLGRWPRLNPFQRRRAKTAQGSNEHAVSIRLPGTLRVRQPGRADWTHYEWYVPLEPGRYRYMVLAVAWVSGFRRLTWRLRYWAYILWVHHIGFNNQDLTVVSHMKGSHPAPAFRPDVSVAAWRDMVANEARAPGTPRAQSSRAQSSRAQSSRQAAE